jgi:hypothetical protein
VKTEADIYTRVAFGIMMGFVFNLIFAQAENDERTLSLILGAPFVPALFLLVGLYFCPESPRYYMRRRSSSFNPPKAYEILRQLRNTEVGGPLTYQRQKDVLTIVAASIAGHILGLQGQYS